MNRIVRGRVRMAGTLLISDYSVFYYPRRKLDMPNIGFGELAIILAIALLVFGPKRLPDVARGIGKSFNAFKEGLKEISAPKEDKPS